MDTMTFAAVDLGAESGRVFLGELSEGRLSVKEAHRFLNDYIVINGKKKWMLYSLFKEIKIGLRKAAEAARTPIAGIGIDTWGVDYGLLDSDGELCFLPCQYRDESFVGASDRFYAEKMDRDAVFQRVGIQSMDINTLFQLYVAGRDNPAALENAETLLMVPDILNYWITGVKKTEYSIASTSQMLNVYDKTWATDIAELAGVPTRILPEINDTGSLLGCVTEDIKAEMGVSYDIPVFSVPEHDTASAVVAVPFESSDAAFISCGTWSLVGMELPGPVVNADSARCNYTNEGGAYNTIRFLKNITGLWIVQECRRFWLAEGKDISYGDMTQQAAECPGFRSLIDPNQQEFVSAGNMPAKIQDFCRRTGQYVPQTVGEIIRCVNDSLALAYRQVILNLEEITGQKIKRIHMVGGGIKNVILSGLTANACQRTVVTGPAEGTVIGNIMVQAISSGAVKDVWEAREIIRRSENIGRVEPDAEVPSEVFDRFDALCDESR
ncbi:MAG: rhamnulokinase [Abditibacteriota bacterium]|nr:rhamnulokinase [Abditibacteriota bacterium]